MGAKNLLLDFIHEVRDKNGAAPDLRRNASRGHRKCGGGVQPDLLPVADVELLGVVGVEFDETIRIVERENAIFALGQSALRFVTNISLPSN